MSAVSVQAEELSSVTLTVPTSVETVPAGGAFLPLRPGSMYDKVFDSNSKEADTMTERIREDLLRLQDRKYRDFQRSLIPTADPETVIGVRTPALREYAKQLAKSEAVSLFLEELPHPTFEENQLHAFLLSDMKEYDRCMAEVIRFLPYVDNWATCDQMSPKVFKKHRQALLGQIREWLRSKEPYTVRFGIKMLMQHFLDEEFDAAYPELVAEIRSDEYYVNMMIAWYFATALSRQYDLVVPFLEARRLDRWTHNKAIQKALESYRIPPERKAYLRSLKRSGTAPDGE